MSFSPLIPVITDKILQSFRQIRANYQAINSAFSNNHRGLTRDPEFSGMHDVMVMRPQAGDPATSATQIAIYNKLIAGVPQLFYAPSSSQTPIQLTFESIKADSSIEQYTFAAGPFVIYGGLLTGVIDGQMETLTPVTNLIYVDLIGVVGTTNIGPVTPTNIVGNSYTIKNTLAIGPFDTYYFAVGV